MKQETLYSGKSMVCNYVKGHGMLPGLFLFFLPFINLRCYSDMAGLPQGYFTSAYQETSLEKVLREVRKEGYRLLYNDELLQSGNKVTFAVKNASLNELLDKSFNDQPFSYILLDETIIIIPSDTGKVKRGRQ